MSSIQRQIDQLLAMVRELQREIASLRASAVQPASWIQGPRGGDAVLIKTPGGGIAAATGTGPYTWGSATCAIVDDSGTVTEETVTVKNLVNQSIAANVVGKASKVGAIYVIDVASCGS